MQYILPEFEGFNYTIRSSDKFRKLTYAEFKTVKLCEELLPLESPQLRSLVVDHAK